MTKTILVVATALTGLSAGLFATFSYAVMPGLRRTADTTFVQSMRGINVAIINPVFLVVFVGALAATIAALVAGWGESSRGWVIAGLVAYGGLLVVTGTLSVPLNDALERGGAPASELRAAFEDGWVRWNHLRTVLSTTAFVCLLVGLARS